MHRCRRRPVSTPGFLCSPTALQPSRIILSKLGLGSRHAKQLGLNHAKLRGSELILGDNLVRPESVMILDSITQEMITFRIDPEIGRSRSEGTGHRLDRDAVGTRSQIERLVTDG